MTFIESILFWLAKAAADLLIGLLLIAAFVAIAYLLTPRSKP